MFQSLFERVWEQKYAFFGVFFLVFMFSYLVLVAIDFVPEPKGAVDEVENLQVEPTSTEIEQSAQTDFNLPMGDVSNPVLPTSLYIEKLDRTIPVLNPSSSEVVDLDNALLNGVVRHPDSAHMAQAGNVFILGHSSYLPSVINQNFQAFNGIQDLAWGDRIEVTSEGFVLTYEVEKVYKAKAADVTIPVADTGARLTLATCNSFGSKDDRFIVEAKRIDIRAL
jgi:LPXTG-site transpeptidase (sortase) family protein